MPLKWIVQKFWENGLSRASVNFWISFSFLIFASLPSVPVEARTLFISPGMSSYHFRSKAGFNNENWGIGFQVDFKGSYSLGAGRFKNSDRHKSNYLTATWYPLKIWQARLGLLGGIFDGYPREREGGWFVAGMPIINYSTETWGVNIAAVPTYKNHIQGAVIIQFLIAIGQR